MEQTSKYSFLDKLNNSRCWCSFDPATMFKGRSQPLDEFDEACKDLVHGYKCIKQRIEMQGETCDPWSADYNIMVSGKVLVGDPEKAFRKCDKYEDDCRKNTCKVELHFIMSLVEAIHNEVDIQTFNHLNPDFVYDDACPRPAYPPNHEVTRLKDFHTGDNFRCCGDFPRVRTYQYRNGDNQCCGSKVYDQTVKKCCDPATSSIDYICME